jgi:hypothetical protein
VDSLHVHHIVEHDAGFQIYYLLPSPSTCRFLRGSRVLSSAHDDVNAGAIGANEAEGRDEAEPASIEIRALIVKTGADNA